MYGSAVARSQRIEHFDVLGCVVVGVFVVATAQLAAAQTESIGQCEPCVSAEACTPSTCAAAPGAQQGVTWSKWQPLAAESPPSAVSASDEPQWKALAQPLTLEHTPSFQAQTPAPPPALRWDLTPTPEMDPTAELTHWLEKASATARGMELVAHETVPIPVEAPVAPPADTLGTATAAWNLEQPGESRGVGDSMVEQSFISPGFHDPHTVMIDPQGPVPAMRPQSPFKFQEPVDSAEAPSLPPSLQAARQSQPPSPTGLQEAIPDFVESVSTNAGIVEVVIGQGRLVTVRQDLAIPGRPEPVVAVGDPTVVHLEVAGPRHLRLTGSRIGVTDVSIITPDRQNLSLEVHVVADLSYMEAILRQSFPTARVRLSQLREHVVVEGQARDARQISQIIDLIQSYLESVQTPTRATGQSRVTANVPRPMGGGIRSPQDEFSSNPGIISPAIIEEGTTMGQQGSLEAGVTPDANQQDLQVTIPPPRIINLMTVPGPQQVMLKVQVAELNRTALRRFGMTFLFQDGQTAIASSVGPALPKAGGIGGMTDLLLGLLNPVGGSGTLFAILNAGEVNFFIDALRRNEVLKIMAEPTLVAMNGQEASFLAGGEFPIPVPQIAAAGVVSAGFQFKPFGVGLTFVPFIQENDVIRLAVAPEVSSLDFATPSSVLPDTVTPVPAFSTRKTRTVVELREGQTLAISGLLQTEVSGSTARIPGLGDIPVVGQFFSSSASRTQEKELVVLVTPYLVEGMDPEEVGALPGEDVQDPTDCEFYLHGRIERRVCEPFRATSAWDDPFGFEHRRHLEARNVCGPYGYTP